MSSIGNLVERLVQFGMPVGMASEIIDEAVILGSTRPTARKKKAAEAAARSGPIPKGFVFDKEIARLEGLNAYLTTREEQNLRDWAAENGIKKIDWQATWRRWCRRTAERLGLKPVGQSIVPSAIDPRTFTAEQWAPILSVYAKTSNWNPAYGPEPGTKGSFATQQSSLL